MAAAPPPAPEDRGHLPASMCVTEININRPARALAWLRFSDYLLVVMCGLAALGSLPDLVASTVNARWAEVLGQGAMVGILGFAAFTGWRHVGVIDPRVWRSSLWVLALLGSVAVLMALQTMPRSLAQADNLLGNPQELMAVYNLLWIGGVAIPGFVCAFLLCRMCLAPMGIRLDELLTRLVERAGVSAPQVTWVQRPRLRRGLAYATLGVGTLLALTFIPVSTDSKHISTFARLIPQLKTLACFLIVRARRYFQVSADSLLAVDHRPPILFLRSFADDERPKYGGSQRALLDFSLETRLANHFHHFGPFIAIGSPKEKVPQPGAARVLLADDEWQARVLGWMRSSQLIIMYGGTSEWVNWELRKVVESGRATSLILMMPEIRVWRRSRRQENLMARVTHIRDVLRDMPWSEPLMKIRDLAGLRALLFRADGSLVMVKSRSRSRDSYHLAALIAHSQLLGAMLDAKPEAMPHDAQPRRRSLRLVANLAGAAAVLTAIYLFWPTNQPTRLAFNRLELYYAKPVTQAEARGVGEYLIQRHYFSGDKAATLRLVRVQGQNQLQLVVDPASANDFLVELHFAVLGSEISRDLLGGKPVEVVLCDKELKPIKVLPTSAKLTLGKGELYYTDPITAREAQQAGDQLLAYFGKEQGFSVHLGREHSTSQVRFVIAQQSRVNEPELIAACREIALAITSQTLGGQPVLLHLCDDEFRILKSERVEPGQNRISAEPVTAEESKSEPVPEPPPPPKSDKLDIKAPPTTLAETAVEAAKTPSPTPVVENRDLYAGLFELEAPVGHWGPERKVPDGYGCSFELEGDPVSRAPFWYNDGVNTMYWPWGWQVFRTNVARMMFKSGTNYPLKVKLLVRKFGGNGGAQ